MEPTARRISEHARRAGFGLTDAQLGAAARLELLLDRIAGGRRIAPRDTIVDPEPRRGIYLWGEVGRGKSWLMDAFLASVGHDRTWRVHYHELFRHFHRAVHAGKSGTDVSGGSDTSGRTAVEAALDALIGDRVVLCIDEFSVNDIADGMLSYRLFTELFERGLFLVITSNYHPDQLLPHPVYHELYLPGIDQLKRELEVVEVGGARDLRTAAPGSVVAGGAGTSEAGTREASTETSHASTAAFRRGRLIHSDDTEGLAEILRQWDLPTEQTPGTIVAGHYEIATTGFAADAARFDFDALCRQARATLDYLNLTDHRTRVVIDGVPRLSRETEAVRRRWVNLIDVLYDRAAELVLVSDHPLDEILDIDGANRDTARTNSRLGLLETRDARV